jgi:hypothetical protein
MEIAAEVERVDPLRAKLDDIDELDNAQAVPALKAIVGDGNCCGCVLKPNYILASVVEK